MSRLQVPHLGRYIEQVEDTWNLALTATRVDDETNNSIKKSATLPPAIEQLEREAFRLSNIVSLRRRGAYKQTSTSTRPNRRELRNMIAPSLGLTACPDYINQVRDRKFTAQTFGVGAFPRQVLDNEFTFGNGSNRRQEYRPFNNYNRPRSRSPCRRGPQREIYTGAHTRFRQYDNAPPRTFSDQSRFNRRAPVDRHRDYSVYSFRKNTYQREQGNFPPPKQRNFPPPNFTDSYGTQARENHQHDYSVISSTYNTQTLEDEREVSRFRHEEFHSREDYEPSSRNNSSLREAVIDHQVVNEIKPLPDVSLAKNDGVNYWDVAEEDEVDYEDGDIEEKGTVNLQVVEETTLATSTLSTGEKSLLSRISEPPPTEPYPIEI